MKKEGLDSLCAEEESGSTIPVPQSIIIKTLTSTGGGKRETEMNAGRAKKRSNIKGEGKKEEEGAGIPTGQSKNKLKEPL